MGFALDGEAGAGRHCGEASGGGQFPAQGFVEFREEAEGWQHFRGIV